MSYFNSEQQDYMRYLASLKPEDKCPCGWTAKGQPCFTPSCTELREREAARTAVGEKA
jgi:hypothetical protein